MDEYVWPSDLPKPGQRGKRTGMGVDHVARLLAGKTAEELHRWNNGKNSWKATEKSDEMKWFTKSDAPRNDF